MMIDLLVNNINFCPEGYEHLYNENWPGIDEGCMCTCNFI